MDRHLLLQVPYVPFVARLLSSSHLADAFDTFVILEPPGVSGLPPRDMQAASATTSAYPTAAEFADAVVRMISTTLHGARTVDAVGHSYGGMILSYVELYHPEVLNRVAYLDCPLFFVHTTCFWPILFTPITYRRIAALLATGAVREAISLFVYGELWHQHVIRHCTWLCEYCSREVDMNTGERHLVVLSQEDTVVDSPAIAEYLAHHFPRVSTHCIEGWGHGTGIRPFTWTKLVHILEGFFAADA